MHAGDNWSTYQLIEFLGAVGTLRRADDVAGRAIQRIAEAVDAELGALVGTEGVLSSIGFPFGEAPEATIADAIESGSGWLDVPGVGRGPTLVVAIEDERFASLLLVRLGEESFTRDEINLVGAMVRVLELVLQNLRGLEAERTVRTTLQERQALLERLARIERSISLRAPLADVLDAITQGLAELLGDEVAGLRLVDPLDPEQLLLVSSRGLTPAQERALRRGPSNASTGGQAFLRGELVIVEDYERSDVGVSELRAERLQAAMAAPVREDGRIVGSLTVATYRAGRRYSASEREMLQAFAEHASMALTDARMIEAMRAAEQEKDVALDELRRGIEEREQLESQLRQSQKMDAVGQLAGGIAHDFNNLLLVILNYSELVAESLDCEDPRRESMLEIVGAAERAAALTRQLLAFSRKEVVRPETIDLNEAVSDLLRLLRRTLRESIELEVALAPALLQTEIDRGQLEQVLMNLVVNAGDAMREGGTLRVETTAQTVGEDASAALPGIVPGDYVVLSVLDSGEGMPAEVVERAFEPFFTTKERGSGTGLGLATVYGIVKQAGGYVSLESTSGSGTTASVYLRVSADEIERTAPRSVPPGREARCAGSILLVEDEDSVRVLLERVLARGGYHVLSARSGCEALEVAAAWEGEIELVLTDVVMPGMSGRELAERIASSRSQVPVVFMSGYPDAVAGELCVLGPETHYLQKPFTAPAVLELIGRVLDAAAVEREGVSA